MVGESVVRESAVADGRDIGGGGLAGIVLTWLVRAARDAGSAPVQVPSEEVGALLHAPADEDFIELDGSDFMGCKVSAARKAKTKICWVDAMQNITRFLASKGKRFCFQGSLAEPG